MVVASQYELEKDDIEAITAVFGPKALKSTTLTRRTYYGKARSGFTLSADEGAARNHLATNSALADDLVKTLEAAADWKAFSAALDATEASEAVTAL